MAGNWNRTNVSKVVIGSGEGGQSEEEEASDVGFSDTVPAAMYERVNEKGSSINEESKANENEAALVQNYVQYLVCYSFLPSLPFVSTLLTQFRRL